jgi:hypothetical protein
MFRATRLREISSRWRKSRGSRICWVGDGTRLRRHSAQPCKRIVDGRSAQIPTIVEAEFEIDVGKPQSSESSGQSCANISRSKPPATKRLVNNPVVDRPPGIFGEERINFRAHRIIRGELAKRGKQNTFSTKRIEILWVNGHGAPRQTTSAEPPHSNAKKRSNGLCAYCDPFKPLVRRAARNRIGVSTPRSRTTSPVLRERGRRAMPALYREPESTARGPAPAAARIAHRRACQAESNRPSENKFHASKYPEDARNAYAPIEMARRKLVAE